MLVPGNHDIAFVDHIVRKRALRLDRFGIVQLANLLKFGEAFAETLGGQRGVCLHRRRAALVPRRLVGGGAGGAPARRRAADDAGAAADRCATGWRERHAFFDYVDKIETARARAARALPRRRPAGRSTDAVIFVLNSVSRVSRHPALNAIGHIGRAQYRRLDRLARQFPQRLKLVAVHHHVVRRGEEQSAEFVTRLFAKFTVLGDSRPLVRFCIRGACARCSTATATCRISCGCRRARCCWPRRRRRWATSWRTIRARSSSATTSRRAPTPTSVGIFRAAIRLPNDDPTPVAAAYFSTDVMKYSCGVQRHHDFRSCR